MISASNICVGDIYFRHSAILFKDNELTNPSEFLPLSPSDFQVLLQLSDQALHGYGIVKASRDDRGRPALELGSLYRIINRLIQQELIEEVDVPQPDTKRRRRHYRATLLGRQVARAEARRLRALLDSDPASRLLGDG